MTDEKHVRPFSEWLVEQRQGRAHAEASAALNELIAAVGTHNKGGTLTLSVSVKPAATGGGTVLVQDKVSLKLPEAERPMALFFIDENDNLTRSDPRQPSLPLRAVDAPDEDDTEAKGAQA